MGLFGGFGMNAQNLSKKRWIQFYCANCDNIMERILESNVEWLLLLGIETSEGFRFSYFTLFITK